MPLHLTNTIPETEPVLLSHLSAEKLVLLVEENDESTSTLRKALCSAAPWPVLWNTSPIEAISTLATLKTQVKIVLFTISRNFETALTFLNQLRDATVEHRFPWPHVLILSRCPLCPETALRLQKRGAEYLLRQYCEPIMEVVRGISWRIRTTKSSAEIVLYRHGDHIAKVLAASGSMKEILRVGPRLREFLEYFGRYSHTEITTVMIADRMGISIRTPKHYMQLLRKAWDQAFRDHPNALSGKDVFVTTKVAGGYVHRVDAHIDIIDENEF